MSADLFYLKNYLSQRFSSSLEKQNFFLPKERFLILTQRNQFFTLQKISAVYAFLDML